MSRVIIIDNPRVEFDTSHLESFGSIVNIRNMMVSPFRVGEFEGKLISTLEHMQFAPRVDYVALIGRQVQVTLGCLAILEYFGTIKLLIYSNSERHYIERKLRCPMLNN